MATKQNVTDESGPSLGDDTEAGFTKGYDATTPDAANSPDYPGNQVYEGVGARAEAYKAHWKQKPGVFPYGTNSQGGK